MKLTIPAIFLTALLTVTSCIRKEPLNAECDILTVTLPDDELARAVEPENDRATMVVKDYVTVTALAPSFTLTPGATIEPPSGTVRDFTEPQTYTVTSQDGQWHKTYTISARHNTSLNLSYDFQDMRVIKTATGGSYDEFYSETVDPETGETNTTVWASGNSGFALTNGTKGPDTYPTFQVDNGYMGRCVCLVTRSTGTWGAMVDKPIAAGNLFIGKFITNIAVAHPRQATQFGAPFMKIPRYFRGWYKYTAAEPYQKLDLENRPGKLTVVPGKKDQCNIYAVFYESTEEMPYLDGDNVLADDNPNIIAIARLPEEMTFGAADWTHFDTTFEFREGVKIDPDKLANGGYCLTIVMTSSIDGDFFSGAIGSTLYVDEISIECL